jgi:hypothetical protein
MITLNEVKSFKAIGIKCFVKYNPNMRFELAI